ncbi:MAG TPA: hypothetical protein VF472_12885 [Burkholderiaceae bacterium]
MNAWPTSRLAAALSAGTMVIFILAGCSSTQLHSDDKVQNLSLSGKDFRDNSVAFITPSTNTGAEEDKQALALVFYDVLHDLRPGQRIESLPQALSSINGAGFSERYQRMLQNYRETGIFEKGALKQLSQITGSRYLAQLKLESFRQESKDRFGLFGLRVMETKSADVRVFLQIWDGQNGAIAWEGTEEMNVSRESISEHAIPFKQAVQEAANKLLAQLPK